MPVSYTPHSGGDGPLTLASFNSRYQEIEDYFLAAIAAGAATQTTITAEAGEGLGDRNAAYLDLSDNKIYKMDADAAGPKAGTIRGFVDGATLIGNDAVLVIGGLMNGFTGLTAWDLVYVATTSGNVTQTRPVPSLEGNQVMIAEMGFAVAADTVLVRPRPIQYQKRAAFSDNETMTVQHHADERGYRRAIWAYITEDEAGAALASYASSNQDSNVALSVGAPATYTADQCTGGTPLGNMTAGGGLAGAFDNNAATYAQRAATSGTIGYDFGSNKTIRRYTVQETTTVAATGAPQAWTLEYSSDNTNWNVADTRSAQTGWTDGEIRTFDVATAYTARYWRLNITNNNGGAGTFVGELEMLEAATYAAGDSKLAQTFNLASTSTVASVGLWLKKVGSPTGTVTVRIETTSAGTPTGTLADVGATATFIESSLGTSYAETVVTFSSSFSLAAGDYAIVISTSRSSNDVNYIDWGADGSSPGYSGGAMYSYDGAWNAESKDAVFGVYTTGTTHPSRVSVDWWSSSFADVVNRYGDGAGADLDTKTTFKCLRDAGFTDLTVVVELP